MCFLLQELHTFETNGTLLYNYTFGNGGVMQHKNLNVKIEGPTYYQFQKVCLLKGTKMSRVIRDFIEEYISQSPTNPDLIDLSPPSQTTDPDQIFRSILTIRLPGYPGANVRSVLTDILLDPKDSTFKSHCESLEVYGIKLLRDGNIAISNKSPQIIRKLNYRYYRRALARHCYCITANHIARIDKKSTRAVLFDGELVASYLRDNR